MLKLFRFNADRPSVNENRCIFFHLLEAKREKIS